MEKAETTTKTQQVFRQILEVKDSETAKKLTQALNEGWKFDPYIATLRLENTAFYPLIFAQEGADISALDPNPKFTKEVEPRKPGEYEDAMDFISTQADDKPNGNTAKLISEGWVQMGYNAPKDKIQLKRPKKDAVK